MCAYDKNYYEGKRQKLQQEAQKAERKWLDLCILSGKEWISYQERMQELQQQLQELNQAEQKSKQESEKIKEQNNEKRKRN